MVGVRRVLRVELSGWPLMVSGSNLGQAAPSGEFFFIVVFDPSFFSHPSASKTISRDGAHRAASLLDGRGCALASGTAPELRSEPVLRSPVPFLYLQEVAT